MPIGDRAITLFAAIMCTTVTACSTSATRSSSNTPPSLAASQAQTKISRETPAAGYLASDGDIDKDDNGNPRAALEPSTLDTFVSATSGGEAGVTDRKAIAALIKGYYAAAAAGDGAKACPMLNSTAMEALAEGRGSSVQGRDRACAAAASSFFAQEHQTLASDNVTTMVIIDVRIKGPVATALLGFRTAPVGTLRLKRESGIWKLVSLLDTRPTT